MEGKYLDAGGAASGGGGGGSPAPLVVHMDSSELQHAVAAAGGLSSSSSSQHHHVGVVGVSVGVGSAVGSGASNNSGDIDSLLTTDPDMGGDKSRRLLEPYERHRAHDLRAECYRRGIRPIKKGPNANDNKNGYIVLLRKYDGHGGGHHHLHAQQLTPPRHDDDDDDDPANGSVGDAGETSGDDQQLLLPAHSSNSNASSSSNNSSNAGSSSIKKRKVQAPTPAASLMGLTPDVVASFYEPNAGGSSANPLVLPMQYGLVKPTQAPNPTTTDLEILSGIANSYTQNTTPVAGDGQLCGGCRSVVTDQLMESIRLGKNKMQLQESSKRLDQRDRDTLHLKHVLGIMADLRKVYREAQADGINQELLSEVEDDLAFFQTLKEQTKERMRLAIQDARDRANSKTNGTV